MNSQKNSSSGIFLILFLLIACTHKKEIKTLEDKYSISCIGISSFTSSIDSILHLFAEKANCKDCFYEMHINRRDYNETLIILRAKSNYPSYKELYQDYINTNKPLLYAENNGIIFFIYSGMEILIDSVSYIKNLNYKDNESSYYDYSWTIILIGHKFEIFEDCWDPPFTKPEFKGIIKYEIPPELREK